MGRLSPVAGEQGPRSGVVVGLVEKRGRFLVASPFFDRGRRMTLERDRRVSPGRLALLRTGAGGRAHARVVRPLGRPDVARDVIEALMLHRGLSRRFPRAVEEGAAEAGPGDRRRRDLRDLPTMTVDPASARDYDDAISAEALPDGAWRVWVHVADVAAHVRVGTALDRESQRRGTSVYVPGAVEPMLPEALSGDACSLVPERDRAAVTVEMELAGAEVRRVAFDRSLIRSDVRLDYDRVDRIFAGRERAEEPWARPLALAREAAAALHQARARGAALEVSSTEPEFEFDEQGHVTRVRPVEQTESHRMIEHLMIAANEQVAGLLEDRGVPALYRVHEPPDPQSVERLLQQLGSLEVPTPPVPESLSPRQAAEAVGEISRLVAGHVRRTGRGAAALNSLVLRALKQAHYSPRNVGHAGLGSPRYCHFTSPIRRYPDLVCHRALLSAVGGEEDPPPAAGLEEAGAWASARERDAMEIERDADDVARCFLLERVLFEEGWERAWDAEVVGLAPVGAFVTFGDAYEGLLPVRRLRGDWWELNEEGSVLHGTRSGRTIRLGDAIRVQVERVDAPRGRVDLEPTGG